MFKRSYRKLGKALALALSIFLVSTLFVEAQTTYGQIFPSLTTNATALGTQSYIITPDPPIGLWQWTDALTGVSNYYEAPYIEAGAHKYSDLFGTYYNPYGAAMDVHGDYYENILGHDDVNLAPGGWYFYQTSYTFLPPYTYWGSWWCGSTLCRVLLNVDLQTSHGLKFATAGAESNYLTVALSAFTTANTVKTSGNIYWQSYCWDTILKSVSGVVTPCDSNHGWYAHNP